MMSSRSCQVCEVEFTACRKKSICSDACKRARRRQIDEASKLKAWTKARAERIQTLLGDVLPGEVWQDILETEGLYKVSSMGRVKSLGTHARVLKPFIDAGGYAKLTLSVRGVLSTHSIHRLMATTFIPNPEMLPLVDHIDRNRENNNITNLRWASSALNNQNNRTVIEAAQKEPVYDHQRHTYHVQVIRDGVRYRRNFQNKDDAVAYKASLLAPFKPDTTITDDELDRCVDELLNEIL